MELLAELENMGVDVREGLDRVMGDESLYKMMLDMFVTTIQTTPIGPDEFDQSDLEGLIGKVHSLKGTTGNLSISPLFDRYTKALNLLREDQPAAAKEIFVELLPIQTAIVDCIQRSKNG